MSCTSLACAPRWCYDKGAHQTDIWGGSVRVLVVYASSRGGTEGLARMVAESLVARGVDADVGDATAVDEITGYDAVIVGGALYNGKWHPEATWFVQRNLAAL